MAGCDLWSRLAVWLRGFGGLPPMLPYNSRHQKQQRNCNGMPAVALLSLVYISSFLYCSNSVILLQVNTMSKRISISCPDHIYKLLSGLAELQSRPMSKIVVELLEASYPALNSVYHTLIRLEAEKRRADSSMASGVDQIMTEFSSTIDSLIGEVQLELSGITPPHSNTGATYSQNTPQPPKLRGV